jgi:hypothetical protein
MIRDNSSAFDSDATDVCHLSQGNCDNSFWSEDDQLGIYYYSIAIVDFIPVCTSTHILRSVQLPFDFNNNKCCVL